MSRGRSAAELQANGCRARIRTWTNRGNNSTRYRVTPRGSGGEKGIRTPAPVATRRPTWVATRPLRPDSLQVSLQRRRESRTLMPARRRLPFSRRWPLPMGDPSVCMRCGLVQTGSNRRLPRCERGALPLSYGPMTAARVTPCRGGGARSTTRPSEPGDRRETAGTRGRTRTSDEPGVGSRRSTTELRACGRRDRDRTDGVLCFRQALYAS
jgi:hypothetical protein